MDFNDIIKQAQNIKTEYDAKKKEFEAMKFTSAAGGGLVKATVQGNKKLVAIEIADKIVSLPQKKVMQDLVMAAVNAAFTEVDTKAKELVPDPMSNIPSDIGDMDFNKIFNK